MKSLNRVIGFTLVEVMIVVAIVGILASVAYPSCVSHVTQSNRAEAQRELVRIANLQEQYFVDQRAYTANMTQLGLAADPYVTDTGNYHIDATLSDNNTKFTLTATAKGTQLSNDSSCSSITITETGKRSGSSAYCWEK